MYLYDRGGNLTGYLSAPYTLAPTLDGVTEMVFYSYDDANWKDKVTAIGGKAITYDAIGNPLTYDGWTFTWKAGRMLASMVKTGTNAQFTYDHNGLRIRKIVNSVTTNYTLNGKNIVHMTQGSNDLHFFYDAQNKPAMVRFNGTDYFYVYNLQGDVVAMIDTNGTQVVEYHYDAWGAPVTKTGTMAATLGTVNPFRYRGYIYDEETGLYYLKNRYYDPLFKRFLNADKRLGKRGGPLLGHNTYAYCMNNPVNWLDATGKFVVPIVVLPSNSPEIDIDPVFDCGFIIASNVNQGPPNGYYSYKNKRGDLYEIWYDEEGKATHSRHHSDHGNKKKHNKNPHDHEWYDDEKGNRTQSHKSADPDPSYQAPEDGSPTVGNAEKGDSLSIVGDLLLLLLGGIWAYILKSPSMYPAW